MIMCVGFFGSAVLKITWTIFEASSSLGLESSFQAGVRSTSSPTSRSSDRATPPSTSGSSDGASSPSTSRSSDGATPPLSPRIPQIFTEDDGGEDADDIIHVNIDQQPPSTISWESLRADPKPNEVVKALLSRRSDALRILNNYPASKKRFRVKKGLKKEKDYVGLDLLHQKLLCDVIVKYSFKTPTRISNVTDKVESLANFIVETFPRERKAQYYTPYRSVKVDGKVLKRHNPKGRLYHKFTNYLKVLREDYVTTGSSNTESRNTSVPELSADVEGSLERLKRRVDICSRLKLECNLTRDARINTLRNEVDSRKENYLTKYIHTLYPFLAQPEGYLLLESDFDALYPDKKNCLFMSWPSLAESIKKLAGVPDHDLTDAEILYLLGDLFEEVGLTSVPVTRKYRAGKQEMLRSFLFHVEFVQDIQKEIDTFESKACQDKTTVQPYAISVGPWPQPTQFYILYDGVLQRVNSVRDSIDLTFKILHAQYPRTSECYWLLLQKLVYELSTPWDSVIPEVDSLVDKLTEC
ncbi:uncharacterized protein LOC117648272 isoform X2 [Thrips palmi]|uniref:Uncharacterized protein LOC117648272 isoform X2 n=1 Tax=Thrips palmi TaxID=161013 RepID=A0A6P8ZCP3_THRPL|nr:uncharacterized protein LOC117648272 isoform X2 [Thrips palmi]XP_034246597.1 uncharacterized protein LOC117648272 isoform X2 [Thrips palmi]